MMKIHDSDNFPKDMTVELTYVCFLRGTETERESFHMLAHTSNACKGQGFATLKPGTRKSTQVCHLDGKSPIT